MSRQISNSFRILPHTVKVHATAAVTSLYFQDNRNRVWRVAVDTRDGYPQTRIIDVTESVLANWHGLSGEQIGRSLALAALEWMASEGEMPEGKETYI